MKNKSFLVAITGGIGSGKSAALKYLQSMGLQTLSCDEITRQSYDFPKIKRWLIKQFPEAVKGKIFKKVDKSLVAKIVFADKEKLAMLTDFLTPVILEETLRQAKRLKGYVFIEVPLLFECNKANCFDMVIVIKRAISERIESVMSRSNLTKEQVLKRINAQFDYENADLTPYTVISNDGTEEELTQKIKAIVKDLHATLE